VLWTKFHIRLLQYGGQLVVGYLIRTAYFKKLIDYISMSLGSTLCLQKVPTFKLSVTVSNLNRFSKLLYCWKAYEICYKTRSTPSASS